jgi:exopolyphosphatase / guanosine-5'-triphosphate,3'-diphosphate pyrophosphatase
MRVGIVDVGSSTVRLLVAAREGGALATVRADREHLHLGEEVERRGRLSARAIAATARCVAEQARLARTAGAVEVRVLVTAPGRQSSNGRELADAIARTSGAPVRVLSAEEEGRLAFAGALAGAGPLTASLAVCDIGGGSTEVVAGTPVGGPVWWRSLDVGCVRLTHRLLRDDPPGKRALATVGAEIERALEGFTPPLPQTAFAVGGTARAVRKLVGKTLAEEELAAALVVLSRRPSRRIARAFALDERRARTLPAGALVLAALRRRLGVDLEVVRTGLREGAALALLAELEAAAA